MSATTPDAKPQAADRDVRAATEAMVVVQVGPGIYEVYSGETETYTVDLMSGACQCPDAQYRAATCKHARRVEMCVGERSIPDGVRADPTLARRRGGGE